MKKIYLMLLCGLLISGCATLSSIKVASKKTVFSKDPNSGMVFLRIDMEGVFMPVVYLHLTPETADCKVKPTKVALHEKGTFNGNFKYDPTYFLVEIPSGTWRINKITDDSSNSYLPGLAGYIAMRSLSQPELGDVDLEFKVEAGEIIYLGTIKVDSKKKSIDIIDEESSAKAELLQNFPNVTELLVKRLATLQHSVRENCQ